VGSKSLVICDPEEGYAQSLAFYIMEQKGLNFQVQVCNCLEHVKAADLLLISGVYPEEERKRIKAEHVLVLSESDFKRCEEGSICKYQSGDEILDEILKICESVFTKEDIFYTSSRKKKGKIIGIFSPVHRIGKTTYALRLGEELALSESVLYLNLEVYGGIGGHFEKGGETLEDILYYARQEKGNLGYMLTKVVRHRGNLDYVLPVPVSEDIKRIQAEEWKELLHQILNQSTYETIILDIDEGIQDVYEILELCSEIHLLEEESEYSTAKMEQFERELAILGYEDLMSKIMRKGEHVWSKQNSYMNES